MINSIQFIDGFPIELPFIGKAQFNFKKGVNILYGPNGCGKSTIVKTLKGYCAIKRGGWTQPSEPAEIGVGRLDGADYPHCYSSYTPAKCKALVTWDGTPSFFNDGDIKLNELCYFYNFKQFDDGITNENDVENLLKNNPSAGQYRLYKINKVIDLIKKGAPIYTKEHFGHFENRDDKLYSMREFQFWSYISRLYIDNFGKGQHTVLLDEPERSLSLGKQKELFLKVIPNELKDYQVIVATHSIYSIFTPNANFIEMEKGYIEDFKKAIGEVSDLIIQDREAQKVVTNENSSIADSSQKFEKCSE